MPDLLLEDLLITLQWQSHNTTHQDSTYINRASIADNHVLAPHTAAIRQHIEAGTIWQSDFAAGTLTPAWQADWVVELDRRSFKTHTGPVRIKPELGRYYPKRMVAQGLEFTGNDSQPFQLIALDDASFTADCNHPLAKFDINLSLEQRAVAGQTAPATALDPIAASIDNGPGVQAIKPDVPMEFMDAEMFKRMDENPDSAFYAQPRMVSHLDATARAEITKIYASFLQPGMKVLDLMSSWQSHLPDTIPDLDVVGLGMNAEELSANPQLADYHVHDLNTEPSLPFADDSFDLVICSASIEYLTQPLVVMQEIQRVLKQQGSFVSTFTDRWFPPKAIAIWSHFHPYEKLHFIADYFHQTDGFTAVNTFSLRGMPRPRDDAYYQKLPFSDPVYAVWGKVV